jgi:hypothetical protein
MRPARSPFTARLTLGLASLAVAALSTSGATFAADPPAKGNDSRESHEGHASSKSRSSAPLVERVQKATRRYRNINVALAEGWKPGTPCVSGPSSGAMGVHFVKEDRIDGKVNPDEPESLMYEPLPNGAYRLVGVEYIIIASAWAADHPKSSVTPSIDGHLTHYVGEPNRYGLPAFHELHVWAWADNPNGNFADWNTEVTCDKQASAE